MPVRRSAGLSSIDRPISPPQAKRRRIDTRSAEGEERGRNCCAASESQISIYSWNVNEIAPFLQPNRITAYFPVSHSAKGTNGGGLPEHCFRNFLRRHNWPTVLFLQEVKINRNDSNSMRAVEQAVKKRADEPQDSYDYKAHFCLPSDRHNARSFGGKVYGVCSIIRTDFRERFVKDIREVEWDKEGRFLIIETQAKENVPKLALINVYAVNGTTHNYKDSKTGLIAGTRHDRKLEVHRLLQEECRKLEKDGFDVVIAGDLNIARTRLDGFPNLRTFPAQHCINRADFEAKFLSTPSKADDGKKGRPPGGETDGSLAMIDTFRHLHPEKRCYTYYSRSASFWGESCDRVDMILIFQRLRDNLVAAGMHETLADRGPSDHVPLYACLDFSEAKAKAKDPLGQPEPPQ